MRHELEIRPARLADIPDLLMLERECFTYDQLSVENLNHLLTRGNADVLVGVAGRQTCASAVVLYRKGCKSARFYSLAVHPRVRGQGFGMRMLAAVEQAALARGMQRMTLEVREGNAPALTLYARACFEIVGRLENYYTDGGTALRMRKFL